MLIRKGLQISLTFACEICKCHFIGHLILVFSMLLSFQEELQHLILTVEDNIWQINSKLGILKQVFQILLCPLIRSFKDIKSVLEELTDFVVFNIKYVRIN